MAKPSKARKAREDKQDTVKAQAAQVQTAYMNTQTATIVRHEFDEGFRLIEEGQRSDGRGVQRLAYGILFAVVRSTADAWDARYLRAAFNMTFEKNDSEDVKKEAREGFKLATTAAIGAKPKDTEEVGTGAQKRNVIVINAAPDIRTWKKRLAAFRRGWELAAIMVGAGYVTGDDQLHGTGDFSDEGPVWDKEEHVFTVPLSAMFYNMRQGYGKVTAFAIHGVTKNGRPMPTQPQNNEGNDYPVQLTAGQRVTITYKTPTRANGRGGQSMLDDMEISVVNFRQAHVTLQPPGNVVDDGKSAVESIKYLAGLKVDNAQSDPALLEHVKNALLYLEACRDAIAKRLAMREAEDAKNKAAADKIAAQFAAAGTKAA